MHDSLFDDQGRLEDPHLWARAESLGLDLERFEADRRSRAPSPNASEGHFRGGVRAGVVTTPTRLPRRRAILGANRRPVFAYTVTVPNDAQLMERLRPTRRARPFASCTARTRASCSASP